MISKGSTTQFIFNIYQKLIKDEELLRLLYYAPKGYDEKQRFHPDPLDASLPNLVNEESVEYWDLVDDRILLGEKTSDLLEKKLCRIYIYEGRRRPVFGNYAVANQEIMITIFAHENYDKDLRISRISDRINDLIALERIAGYGMLEYQAGDPREAPTHYRGYYHRYLMAVSKK